MFLSLIQPTFRKADHFHIINIHFNVSYWIVVISKVRVREFSCIKQKTCSMCLFQDAERILEAYEHMKSIPDFGRDPEELKRAALIMSLTAWETYVEDKISEEVALQTKVLQGSQIGNFINNSLEKELKFFHTPNSKKTKDIFERFVGIDVTESWSWPGYEDPDKTKTKLNEWIKKRGDAVHRSVADKQISHLICKPEAEKCIKFFKNLVEATDAALSR